MTTLITVLPSLGWEHLRLSVVRGPDKRRTMPGRYHGSVKDAN